VKSLLWSDTNLPFAEGLFHGDFVLLGQFFGTAGRLRIFLPAPECSRRILHNHDLPIVTTAYYAQGNVQFEAVSL